MLFELQCSDPASSTYTPDCCWDPKHEQQTQLYCAIDAVFVAVLNTSGISRLTKAPAKQSFISDSSSAWEKAQNETDIETSP